MFDSAVMVLAEADDQLRDHLVTQLDADQAVVHSARDAAQAKAKTTAHRPAALIIGQLDRPAAPVALLRTVRGSSGHRTDPPADVPIAMLIDEHDELGALRAYDAGADDVIARTSSYPVLRARLRVLLGLAGRSRVRRCVCVGPVELDAAAHEVRLHDEPVQLSGKEFGLLSVLIAEPTRVFTREELLRDVWGHRCIQGTRTIDSHAARLRKKLTAHGDRLITNVWGVGYRLVDPAPGERSLAA
jgi:DNA-binding response OmpR family regulator